MSFLKGGFSAQRYTTPTRAFGEDEVERLKAFSIDRTREGEDGVQAGWAGGVHKYDGDLSCEKNLRGEFLCWTFRVTKFAPPADEVKAVYEVELKGVMDAAGVERPTSEMKREAREAAQAKLEEDGKDGRYLKHTLVPVVWDGLTGQVWYGATSHTHVGRFLDLFSTTFGVTPDPITSQTFVAAVTTADDLGGLVPAFGDHPAWVESEDSFDWLGNEFALWLLWSESEGLPTGVAAVPAFRLTLSDPEGLTGTDTFSVETPVSLPEVRRALQDGKWPRSTGLVTTLDGQAVSLTIDPELWVVSGAKVPDIEDVPDGQHRDVQRLEQVRGVFRTLDVALERFLDLRTGDGWVVVAEQINNWTGRVPVGAS